MLKFDRPTLVTITAPTASGKNYLRDLLEKEFGWNRIVSTTTRAKRSGEIDGEDYYFIDEAESRTLEADGKFAELLEFRGTRYGVTNTEMDRKMNQEAPALVILEPQGLALYKAMCAKEGWDVYSLYVHTLEKTRLSRLTERTVADVHEISTVLTQMVLDEEQVTPPGSKMTFSLPAVQFEKLIGTHTDRVLSIVGEERRWLQTNIWNAIVPGDDATKALEMIRHGVRWRNHQNSPPQEYSHRNLNAAVAATA